jgi:AraC family transcriptional regulator, transcriptional activator FtrA
VRDRTANPELGPEREGAGRPHHLAVLVVEGVSPFELGVACEVFGTAWSATLGVPWYRLSLCTARPGPVTADGGLQIHVPNGLAPLRRADTVIVLPTERADLVPPAALLALRAAHRRGARVVSLCTGAHLLARAGLLDGRRATTHWSECDDLARAHPEVSVDASVLFVDDGDILTSAGSAAGIDLCLHLVRLDHGAETATQLARQLVVPPQRDGGQAQFIEAPLPRLHDANRFADTLAWMDGHLDEAVTIEDLAGRAAMSPRTFARHFVAATGTTPYQWLTRQRVQLAQRLLEGSDLSIESVAVACGFGTAANLRKQFGRALHTSPQQYRRTFQARRAG